MTLPDECFLFLIVTNFLSLVYAKFRLPFARLDAKSLLSLCSLELHAPVKLCPDTAGDLTAFCADIAPFLV